MSGAVCSELFASDASAGASAKAKVTMGDTMGTQWAPSSGR